MQSSFMLDVGRYAAKDDDKLWREYREKFDIALACICCGSLENIDGRGNYNMCGACENALHCSKECQIKHWSEHKDRCEEIRKSKKKRQDSNIIRSH